MLVNMRYFEKGVAFNVRLRMSNGSQLTRVFFLTMDETEESAYQLLSQKPYYIDVISVKKMGEVLAKTI